MRFCPQNTSKKNVGWANKSSYYNFLEVEWLSIFTVQWNPDFLNHLEKSKLAQIIG